MMRLSIAEFISEVGLSIFADFLDLGQFALLTGQFRMNAVYYFKGGLLGGVGLSEIGNFINSPTPERVIIAFDLGTLILVLLIVCLILPVKILVRG